MWNLNIICTFFHNSTLILKCFSTKESHTEYSAGRNINIFFEVVMCSYAFKNQEDKGLSVLSYFIPSVHATSPEMFHGKVDEKKDCLFQLNFWSFNVSCSFYSHRWR